MKTKLINLFGILLMAFTLITFESCEKELPTPALIEQSFSVVTQTDASLMRTKSWNPLEWIYNYSEEPATLTLTGTGASAGNDYTTTATVSELQAGVVTINMLPGTYTAEYTTPHQRTTDEYSLNDLDASALSWAPILGDVLDIDVSNVDMAMTGTPIPLEATLDDYLLIVDIPTLTGGVQISANDFSGSQCKLIWNETDKYHWGYSDANQGDKITAIKFTVDGVEKIVDVSSYQNGIAYHLISAFNAATQITIPNMDEVIIIVE